MDVIHLLRYVLYFTFAYMYAIGGAIACQCESEHLQDIFCRSSFVGVIMVDSYDIGTTWNQPSIRYNQNYIHSPFPRDDKYIVMARATVTNIYKGKYEDFREGETTYLFTTSGECKQPSRIGAFLISGNVHNGGLLVDKCSFRYNLNKFSQSQLLTIQSHINTRAYVRGCKECKIVESSHPSAEDENQCIAKQETPVSVSACFRDSMSGRCQNVDKPRFDSRHITLKKYQQLFQTRSSGSFIASKSRVAMPRFPSISKQVSRSVATRLFTGLRLRDPVRSNKPIAPPPERIDAPPEKDEQEKHASDASQKKVQRLTVNVSGWKWKKVPRSRRWYKN